MTFISAFEMLNYGLVLVFGTILSLFFAGGWNGKKEKILIFAVCLIFLLTQAIASAIWGTDVVKAIYPLIVHLPLVLVLIFAVKKPIGVALVAVCTAYLCCQLPRWVDLALVALGCSDVVSKLGYTISIVLIFFLLKRYFAPAAYDAYS